MIIFVAFFAKNLLLIRAPEQLELGLYHLSDLINLQIFKEIIRMLVDLHIFTGDMLYAKKYLISRFVAN
jgi:hypothetical protein